MTRIWVVQFPIFGPMMPHEFPLWSSICRWTKINPGNHQFFLERILQTPKWMAGSLLDGRINSKSHPNAICLISMISTRNAWFHPMWLGYLPMQKPNQFDDFPSYQPPIPAMFDDTSWVFSILYIFIPSWKTTFFFKYITMKKHHLYSIFVI